MNEKLNEEISEPIKRHRKGAMLDKGFPGGVVLLLMLAFVVFFQVISGWKIMQLEREKAILEEQKANYSFLSKELPLRRAEFGELESKKIGLAGEVAETEGTLIKLKREVKESNIKAGEIISKRTIAEIQLKNINKQISEKSSGIAEMNSQLNVITEKVNDLKSQSNYQKTEVTRLQQSIEEKKKIESELKSQIEKLKYHQLNNATVALSDIVNKLKDRIAVFKESQDESRIQIDNSVQKLDSAASNMAKSVAGVEQKAVKFENSTGQFVERIHVTVSEITEVKTELKDSSSRLKEIASMTVDVFNEFKKSQLEMEKTLIALNELNKKINEEAERLSSNGKNFGEKLNTLKNDVKNSMAQIKKIRDANLAIQKELSKTVNNFKKDKNK